MESLKSKSAKKATKEAKDTANKEAKDAKDEVMHEIFEFIKKDASISQELIKAKIKNKSIEFMSTLLDDPEQAVAEMSSNIDDLVIGGVGQSVENYLKNSKKVAKLFVQAVDRALHFYIVLKSDTEANRSKLYDYLDDYDDLAFSNRVEIHFHFIDEDLSEKLDDSTTLLF